MARAAHLLAALACGWVVATAVADEPVPADAPAGVTAETFSREVAPLLERRCGGCHGADLQEAGLRLDLREGLEVGGRSGPPLAPSSSAESLIVQAIRRVDPDLAMPPDEPLAAAEIDLIVRWIDAGAPHPAGSLQVRPRPPFDLAAARAFWSLRPLVRPAVPAIATAETPIDAFLEADLHARDLAPTPSADRATLIRRVTFDLTGLPPTPDEIDAFLADESPDAFARVVDRLLASPRYGEHWGRHWLDVVRYADSNGLDENVAHGNAWRYRDWVIRALNDDMPFDRFAAAQIAGDLLVPAGAADQTRHDLLVATGFLVLGPKVLAEGDQTKLMMDVIDEQIDTTGRTFLGLSLGCARCHDHKFDPVAQADYYALAGIFKSTRTMESLARIAKWHENDVATLAEREAAAAHAARVAAGKAAIDAFVADTRATVVAARAAAAADGAATAPPAVEEQDFPEEARTKLVALRDAQKTLEAAAPQRPTAMGVQEAEPAEVPIHVRGSHLALGRRVPRGVPTVLELDGPVAVPAAGSGRRELAAWLADPRNPLTPRVIVNRVWRWHFGRGLVPTPDNFGRTGEPPTHPALLDWLAAEFIERGWSLKSLHRAILLSAAWRRSSDPATTATAARASTIDPDNRLWWRADVRRLEAESIRDAMLAVSGTLDTTMGGSLLHVANRAFLFDHTSIDGTKYDAPRRSVYLPVIRNHISDALWLFDCTDGAVGSGDRATSTVASQALYLMNAESVMQAADTLGRSIVAAAPHDAGMRTELLVRRVLGRRPSDREAAIVRRTVDRVRDELSRSGAAAAEAEAGGWTAAAQALLASNDFLMVR